jgi:ribonuclease P protein component
MSQSFPKSARLNSKKAIGQLFQNGNSFLDFPFRVLWINTELTHLPHLQVAFSVPKRRFKKAVDRNLLKRRMREAFRKNQSALKNTLTSNDKRVQLMLIYVADRKMTYSEMELKIILILQRLVDANG